MPLETMNIGSCPVEEPCVSVSSDVLYMNAMRMECRLFRAALQRVHGIADDNGVSLVISSNPHDFGSYLEVDAKYADDNDDAASFACDLENGFAYWRDAGMSVTNGIVDGVVTIHATDLRQFTFTMSVSLGVVRVEVDATGDLRVEAVLQADNTPVPITGNIGTRITDEAAKRVNIVAAVLGGEQIRPLSCCAIPCHV